MAELWDAYNIDFEKIPGITLVRGKPLPEGILHLVCEVAVRHTDGEYLIMQRDTKKPHGGMWELSACGSAFQGEGPLECAKRELKEETEIEAEEIQELGRIFNIQRHTIYIDYLCTVNCPKHQIRLQKGETVDYRWISPDHIPTVPNLLTKRIQIFLRDLIPIHNTGANGDSSI